MSPPELLIPSFRSGETRQLHPRELLRQVANSMNWKYNDLSVTVPAHTTWQATIRTAGEALGDVDKPIVLMPSRSHTVLTHLNENAPSTHPRIELADMVPTFSTSVEPAVNLDTLHGAFSFK